MTLHAVKGAPAIYFVKSTSLLFETDSANVYDLGLEVDNIPAGDYFWWVSMIASDKSGTIRLWISDSWASVGNAMPDTAAVRWPVRGGADVTGKGNSDNNFNIGAGPATFIGALTLAAPASLKLQAAASGFVSNYSMYDRSFGLLKMA